MSGFICPVTGEYHTPRINSYVYQHFLEETDADLQSFGNYRLWLYPEGFLKSAEDAPLPALGYEDQFVPHARALAQIAHRGQTRDDGSPYIYHPGRVASRVSLHPIGSPVTEAVAWLHDSDEDTLFTCLYIGRHFPDTDIPDMVGELTNVSKRQAPHANRAKRKEMDRERLRGVRRESKIIKMIDRIDNISDMKGNSREFALKYADESIALAEVLRDADPELNDELLEAIEVCRTNAQHGG